MVLPQDFKEKGIFMISQQQIKKVCKWNVNFSHGGEIIPMGSYPSEKGAEMILQKAEELSQLYTGNVEEFKELVREKVIHDLIIETTCRTL